MRRPRVFISSTCYDLGQVRDDLKAFIESLGYEAVLSEYPSFPVHPDKTTIENSQSAVRNNCDLFVLIVGERYGTVDTETQRSITNGEYTRARAEGIPVYAFVSKTVSALLPSWRLDNSFAPPQVESPRVFEFVDELKSSLAWVFPFETAADITDALRTQWAYLFSDSLEKAELLKEDPLPQRLGLQGEALEIAVTKPEAWEYRLFVSLLTGELERRAALRRDVKTAFTTETVQHLTDPAEFVDWMKHRMTAALRILESWKKVVPELNEACGPAGSPGDMTQIVYVASRLGLAYEAALEWTLTLHRVEVLPDLERLRELSSHFMDDVIESFPRVREEWLHILEAVASGDATGTVEIEWVVDVPDEVVQAHESELQRIARKYQLG